MFEVKAINETSIEYIFGSNINALTNQKVLKVYKYLNNKYILDLIPTYTSLAIEFTSQCKLFSDIHAFDEDVKKALEQENLTGSKNHLIEVDYNGEDIPYLCQTLDLSKEELINIHLSKTYTVAMLGFKEYFPYLFGLGERLNIPRRKDPRLQVKKGSVAIAAGQCGIYSEDSPGGWHILGHTNFDDFKELQASDTITFRRSHAN